MHRLSNGTQVTSLPTPAAVSGTPGYATAGSPGVTPASVIDPDAFNTHQEELIAVIAAAGITLDKTNNAQLLAALNARFLPLRGMQVFTTSGNFTVPAGAIRLRVRVIGGGGGGAGCASGDAGGCGGAGGYSEGIIVVTPGDVITVTIGSGGSGGTAGNNNGGDGGTSSFGAFLSATGGNGGGNNGSTFAGGVGGVGIGGIVNVYGSSGSDGGSSITSVNGQGGASQFGGAARAVNGGGAVGNAGGYGSGGGGSYSGSGIGGAGSAGIVVVEW
jgi:hypothetical protein